VILFPSWHVGTVKELGSTPLGDAVRNLGFRHIEGSAKEGTSPGEGFNPLSGIIPLLTAVSANSTQSNKVETKPSRYLVAKGLPTLPMKLMEKMWCGHGGIPAHSSLLTAG
jgi:hypothetical protein